MSNGILMIFSLMSDGLFYNWQAIIVKIVIFSNVSFDGKKCVFMVSHVCPRIENKTPTSLGNVI